ncbi:MAG: hypothetical protein PHP64_01060 [Actinomycetota bacterium]|nr:hypothetical protein [Actinomycetota bacterium]
MRFFALRKGLAFLLVFLFIAGFSGCGRSVDSYKAEYKKRLDSFEDRVTKDDKKVGGLISKNDIAGALKEIRRRVRDVDSFTTKMIDMLPPDELQRVYILTLYYLSCLASQLEAQESWLDAAIAGKPTNDLQEIVKKEAGKTKFAGSELAIELQKQGITLNK